MYQEKLAKLATFDDELDFYNESIEDADKAVSDLQKLLNDKSDEVDQLRR